jgi:hypothetical protein
MACSSFSSNQMNKQPSVANNNDYSSSILFQLGTLFRDGKGNALFLHDAEPIQLRNKPKQKTFLNNNKKKFDSQRKHINRKAKEKFNHEYLEKHRVLKSHHYQQLIQK